MIRVIKSRRVGLKGHVGEEKCIEVLVGRPEITSRPRRMFEDNIKMNLKELEWKDMNYVYLVSMETGVSLL